MSTAERLMADLMVEIDRLQLENRALRTENAKQHDELVDAQDAIHELQMMNERARV